MRWNHIFYKIGAWSYILLGLGHLATQWLSPKSTQQESMLEIMRNFSMNILGSEGNIYLYYMGFSTTMGLLLVAYGYHALVSSRLFSQNNFYLQRHLLLFHIVLSILITLLSIKFFFIAPIAFMCIATLSFILSFMLSQSE